MSKLPKIIITWENVERNLCVICDASLIGSSSYHTCNNCGKVCSLKFREITKTVRDVKSVCCSADISSNQKITCSKKCHDILVKQMLKEHGKFKKVIDIESGIAYKIPTRLIIQNGINYNDLKNFLVWDEE